MTIQEKALAALERMQLELDSDQRLLTDQQDRLELRRRDLDALAAALLTAPPPGSVSSPLFFDDFERWAVESKRLKVGGRSNEQDMFVDGPIEGPWNQYQGSRGLAPNNVFEVTDWVPAGGGPKTFHVKTFAQDHAAAGEALKNALLADDRSKQDFGRLWDGDIYSCAQRLYFPSDGNPWMGGPDGVRGGAPRLLDIGHRQFANVAEMRLSITGPRNTLSLNRKTTFWDPARPDDQGHTPRDVHAGNTGGFGAGVMPSADAWHELELRVKLGRLPGLDKGHYPFDPTSPGWFQIILEGAVVLAASCTTLPPHADETKHPLNSLECGATISGVPCEWFIDWVRFETADGPLI
jgi:hypothetical protein